MKLKKHEQKLSQHESNTSTQAAESSSFTRSDSSSISQRVTSETSIASGPSITSQTAETSGESSNPIVVKEEPVEVKPANAVAVLVGSSRRKRSRPSKSAQCRETLIPEDPAAKKLKETLTPGESATQSENSDSSQNTSKVLKEDPSLKDYEKNEPAETAAGTQPKLKHIIPRIVVDVCPQTPETVELTQPLAYVDSTPPATKGTVLKTTSISGCKPDWS